MKPDTAVFDTAVFDVDGTLVDTNYHHAIAWFRAFRRHRIAVPVWRLHRAIGMGGDQLVAAVAGEDVENRLGDELRAAWTEEFDPLLREVQPFAGVVELLTDVRRRGFRIVLASSGKAEHVEHYLGLFDGKALSDGWTTSADVQRTKPAPDLLEAALRAVDGTAGVLVGDSVWDFRAAAALDAPGYAVRSGGFSDDELCAAGAREVFDSPDELRQRLDETLLAGA
ncbi:HAD family hydrolase [Pseudonocardia nigra]|uniref:HAD family hydrolase n=1 Tax=Pseudonocardia nigra TaxID=1921578 RepID=UPI0027E295F3|nr:HAD family hydrolase [Pseudonocardia nigra]